MGGGGIGGMQMSPRLRNFTLTAHVTLSVGWLGAVAAYLALAVTGLTSGDAATARAAYVAMGLIGWLVIVPLAFAALVSGLVQSLGTPWGVFRHYWVVAKLVLTVVSIAILVAHMRTAVSAMTAVAAGATAGSDVRELQMHLLAHAIGGLVVLAVITALSISKPWGLTPYGRRRQR